MNWRILVGIAGVLIIPISFGLYLDWYFRTHPEMLAQLLEAVPILIFVGCCIIGLLLIGWAVGAFDRVPSIRMPPPR